jgi:hypothetical protein
VGWGHRSAIRSEQQTLQECWRLRPSVGGPLAGALLENGMGLVPELAIDNGLVFAGVGDTLVYGIANIDSVVQEPIEYALIEQVAVPVKRDWSATWRNWIITTMERRNNDYTGQLSGTNSPSRRAATGSDAILAGMGRRPTSADQRWLRRFEAWEKAERCRKLLVANDTDEVREKISEGSISLSEGQASRLDGPSEIGSGTLHEEAVPLSRLIDVVNDRFGTDFNQADQLFFDQIIEAAVADHALRQAAAVNSGDKFELVFKNLLEALFVERMDQNEEIFARFMNDKSFQNVVTGWLSSEAYRKLRDFNCDSSDAEEAI